MLWEAALWCGLAWAGAAGIPALAAWLGRRGGEVAREAARALPWLHLFPLYLALITGAVTGRDAGLYGLDGNRWARGMLAGGAALTVAAGLLWWRTPAAPWPPVSVVLTDEARWALYRGTGALWSGHLLGAAGAGLALAGLEWLAQARPWKRPWCTALWPGPSRLVASGVLFALTGNAWLTAAAHLALVGLARRRAFKGSGESPAEEG